MCFNLRSKATGKKALRIYGMAVVLCLFVLIQNIGQAGNLDQQMMEAVKNGDLSHVKTLISNGA